MVWVVSCANRPANRGTSNRSIAMPGRVARNADEQKTNHECLSDVGYFSPDRHSLKSCADLLTYSTYSNHPVFRSMIF